MGALYKGMFAPLMASSPIFALSFVGFGFGKKLQQSHPEEAVGPLKLAAAGCLSGLMTTVIMAPAERAKCLLQVQADRCKRGAEGSLQRSHRCRSQPLQGGRVAKHLQRERSHGSQGCSRQ